MQLDKNYELEEVAKIKSSLYCFKINKNYL